MKRKFKILWKLFAAGMAAFGILSVFSAFYYHVPIRLKSSTKSTDYIWEKNKFYMRATEGYSYGKTDGNGFNNAEIIDDINILVMGSSQIEAFNVLQNENAVYRLNERFKQGNIDMCAYNIGTSGHSLDYCVNNIENAVKEFSPKDYVIIETQETDFSAEALSKVLNGTHERLKTSDSGLLYYLQKSDYIRLLYAQYQAYRLQNVKHFVAAGTELSAEEKYAYEHALDAFLHKASAAVEPCRLIIFLDDFIKANEKNMVLEREREYYYNAFVNACEKNNIIFLDMHDAFAAYYEKENKFPHGFSNTRVGVGHLNKYGHDVISQVLYDAITELEAK